MNNGYLWSAVLVQKALVIMDGYNLKFVKMD